MTRFTLTLPLALALCLVGCGKGTPDSEPAAGAAAPDAGQTNTVETTAYNPDADRLKEEKELFESDNANTRYAALEEASDYISLVELSPDAAGGTSLTFIKNYKGALSTVDLKTPKGIVPNQEYIIFYRDTPDGTIRPTHATNGLYKVDGSDDELLRYMEQKYAPDDERSDKGARDDKDDASSEDRDTSSRSSSSSSSSGTSSTSSKTRSSEASNDSSSSDKRSSSNDAQTSKRSIDLEN